jgi:hypothetical protein
VKKIAQNVAQPIVFINKYRNFRKKVAQEFRPLLYFLTKQPKENNRPIGKNSPNLATLVENHQANG